MKGDGEPHLQRLLRQLANLRREAAGGDRDLPRADADAPWRIEDLDRLHEIGEIGQRLAHAHEDEIVHPLLRSSSVSHDLLDDLAGVRLRSKPSSPLAQNLQP